MATITDAVGDLPGPGSLELPEDRSLTLRTLSLFYSFVTAAGCYTMEQKAGQYVANMPDYAQHMVNSGAHPFLGLSGALIGEEVVRRVEPSRFKRLITYGAPAVGALVINFGVETTQSLVRHGTPLHFLFNETRETGYDTLGMGVGLFVFGAIKTYEWLRSKFRNADDASAGRLYPADGFVSAENRPEY